MIVDQLTTVDDGDEDRFTRLEAAIVALQHEVIDLRAERAGERSSETADSEPMGSRRHLLKMAGGVAAATVAGVVLGDGTRPAAAATGDAFFVGKRNFASHLTKLNNGTTAGPLPSDPLTTERTLFWADNTGSTLNDSIGIRGDGREAGIGVDGYGNTGVRATGGRFGVDATGATGLRGTGSGVGVLGTGLTGVQGIGTEIAGFESIGVLGSATGGDRGYGVVARGITASLMLSSFTTAPPPQRADNHLAGEIELDGNGTFWVCVADGAPGTWRSIGATNSAGSLYAIAPTRAYDSRWPGNGPLPAGASKVISVADGHDLAGAVTAADVVPKGATAIAYNLTVTKTRGGGFLSVNPGSSTSFSSSSINWFGDNQDIANGLVVAVDEEREVVVFCGGGGTTDFIIDITGYYH